MLAFLTACANILIYGLAGWGIVASTEHRSHARAAGLFLAIGFALGSFGGHAGAEAESLLLLRGLGSVVGLGALSMLMFVRLRRIAQ